jgi:hypothetical protein
MRAALGPVGLVTDTHHRASRRPGGGPVVAVLLMPGR